MVPKDLEGPEYDGVVIGLEHAFGKVLRQLRMSRNLSQQELATESGLGRTFISLLERGLRRPSLSTIFLLSRPLGLSPAQLVQAVDEKLKTAFRHRR